LAKLARKNGWRENRVRGSQHSFEKEGVKEVLTIPLHGNKALPIRTAKSILKLIEDTK
jgi:predicted RNA binding protein YcfA (HicA-like mRNA interferase family)